MKNQCSYLYALMRANMISHMPDKKRLLVMSFFMLLQNALFFVLWGLFFDKVSHVNGWQFEDLARMYGIVTVAVGGSLFFFSGVRTIAYRIHDGTFDGFLMRPRSALPMLMMSESAPASLGDALFGFVAWYLYGNLSWGDVPLLLSVSLMAIIIFVSMLIIIYSIAFWLKGHARFSDQMFESLIIASANIIHGQPFGVRLIAFTIMPAGFISYLPTLLVREFDGMIFAALIAATIFYTGLAAAIFNAGLRRYVRL